MFWRPWLRSSVCIFSMSFSYQILRLHQSNVISVLKVYRYWSSIMWSWSKFAFPFTITSSLSRIIPLLGVYLIGTGFAGQGWEVGTPSLFVLKSMKNFLKLNLKGNSDLPRNNLGRIVTWSFVYSEQTQRTLACFSDMLSGRHDCLAHETGYCRLQPFIS
jgi:hypothetical protein